MRTDITFFTIYFLADIHDIQKFLNDQNIASDQFFARTKIFFQVILSNNQQIYPEHALALPDFNKPFVTDLILKLYLFLK